MISYSRNIKEDICKLNNLSLDDKDLIFPARIEYQFPAEWINRLKEFFVWNEHIAIFSDCDTDGLCAASVCKAFLGEGSIHYYTTTRRNREFTPERIDDIVKDHPEITGIVTVDCGINSLRAAEYAYSIGIDLVITDHHNPEVDINTCVVINPKMDKKSTVFKELCGAGVIYIALRQIYGDNPIAAQYAAVATVGDMVPLLGDNRYIVQKGLNLIAASKESPVNVLAKHLGIAGSIRTEKDIGWSLAPAINSASRMNEERNGLDAVVGCDESATKKLKDANVRRKEQTLQTYEANRDSVLVSTAAVSMPCDYPNLAGIVANKLASEFGLIGLSYCKIDDSYVFSVRAGDWAVKLTDFINQYSEKYNLQGGGHDAAAGFSANISNVDEIITTFHKWCEENRTDDTKKESVIKIEFGESIQCLQAKESMRPFGVGFEEPIFYSESVMVKHTGKTAKGYNKYTVGTDNLSATFYDYRNVMDEATGLFNIRYTISTNRLLRQTEVQITERYRAR